MSEGVCAVYAERLNGERIVSYEASRKLIPASVTKLITTGLALKVLGSDFKYQTKLAYSGQIVDSVLVGDLYIVGGGDPLTAAQVDGVQTEKSLFASWTKSIKSLGIKSIRGRVVGDSRFFCDSALENDSWSLSDLGFAYGAVPSGLNFNQNIQSFHIAPGPASMTRPYVRQVYPQIPWTEIVINAITSQSATYDDIYCVNSVHSPIVEFRGSFPLSAKGYTLKCSNRHGALTCAYRFCEYLKFAGISVSDGYADVDTQGYLRTMPGVFKRGAKVVAPSDLKLISTTESLPMSQLVHITNHVSDNFIAETLMRTLGLEYSGQCQYSACYSAYNQYLAEMGLNVKGGCKLYDGSGLSRKNYISPRFIVDFLKAMSKTSAYEDFYNSLPTPGTRESSLQNRFSSSPDALKQRIHMKSGSMNGVRCFGGYIESEDGDESKRIAFAVMTNNIIASSSKVYALIEDIILSIMEAK